MGLREPAKKFQPPGRASRRSPMRALFLICGLVRAVAALPSGLFLAAVFGVFSLQAQTACAPTPAFTPCEIVFELSAADLASHAHPYKTVELSAEFRSPRHRTFLLPAYWDGGQRMVIRFTPVEAGSWDFRVSSNIAAFEGKTGQFSATESESPGFVRVANMHHFATTAGLGNTPHLWMGDTLLRLAAVDDAAFRKFIDARDAQKFTHISGNALGTPEDTAKAFPTPDEPDPGYFRQLDERIRYANQKSMTVDLLLAGGENQLRKLFPGWEQRARYVRYLIARYAGMNITWGGVENFEDEDYEDGRDLLKEIGLLLKKEDPYQHLRSTGTRATSAPLLDDGWMDFVTQESADEAVGAIEHQLYPVPFVNMAFAGKPSATGDAFRYRLWNAAMNGQYVTAAGVNEAGAAQMKTWFTFFADNRHWELEPFFDVDGGRAVALEDVKYILDVEKPAGPAQGLVEHHSHGVGWPNPAKGQTLPLKGIKKWRIGGEAPDRTT